MQPPPKCPPPSCHACFPPRTDLTAKAPAFAALLQELEAAGAVARWGADGSIGDVAARADGTLDLASFSAYDPMAKPMFVGVPSMSAVGRRLAEAAGAARPGLELLLATRVRALRRPEGGGGGWLLDLERRAAPAGGGAAGSDAARCAEG
jgi:hypothetical protein